MTTPGTSDTGPGSTGSSAGPDMPRPGAPGAGSAGPGSTATEARATPGQATVPPQVGHASAADMMAETEQPQRGYATGADIIAAPARMSWAAVFCGGLAMLAVGVMLLVWPSATLGVVAVLIGAAIVASGLVGLYEGFTARAESGGMRAAYVVIGLLAVIVGIYCIRNHALTLFLVAFVAGVYFIMHGIAQIGVALSAKVHGRAVRAVLGVFSLAAGVLMVVWPGITLAILVILVAAWLLFYGLALCVLAFSLRHAAKAAVSRLGATPALAAQ
jgi:uncharacterized membrane protein HdeD (DUF308 family)